MMTPRMNLLTKTNSLSASLTNLQSDGGLTKNKTRQGHWRVDNGTTTSVETNAYIRRRLGGRQPLCGTGVTS